MLQQASQCDQVWQPMYVHTHRETTTGSSKCEALSDWRPTAGCKVTPAAEHGFRVLVWVRLPSSSLAKWALALHCWLDVCEQGCVLSWAVDWTAWGVFPHVFAALEGEGPAAETLDVSEMKSVSPGLGLPSTMLSGVTGVSTLGESWSWAANDGLLKWDGEVKPEVRSDCRWFADGSRVNNWKAKERQNKWESPTRTALILHVPCDVPAVTKNLT